MHQLGRKVGKSNLAYYRHIKHRFRSFRSFFSESDDLRVEDFEKKFYKFSKGIDEELNIV